MHQITALLLTLLFLTFTGCEEKKPEQDSIPVENTTVIVTQEKKVDLTQKVQQIKEVKEIQSTTEKIPEEIHTQTVKNHDNTFVLLDIEEKSYTAELTQEGVIFPHNTKPIVLVQFFATWCAPCLGEIAYLNDLQEANKEDLFVTGILTRDNIDTPALQTFIKEHQINYMLLRNQTDDTLGGDIAQKLGIEGTYSIPLIVIYLEGKYYTHYEGSVPVEMIKYDIKQAKKNYKTMKNKGNPYVRSI